ncbi:EI24 domain-containing protein [Profundibacter sp.]|uniref:EI24 domain-containing protein n=1 Tax=Profundibacter sp. TaxID=3101071 RepID=UPI003D0A3A4B
MIFSDFAKAVSQLTDPRFLKVLLFGLAMTIALLFGFYGGFLWLIDKLAPDTLTIPFVGEVTWLKDLLSWGSVGFMLILSFFLMIPVVSAFTGLFLEDIAKAVERRYYPDLPPAPRIPFRENIIDTLNFLGVLIGANILAILVYTITNVASPLVFWALNGFLLGREYFQLAAMRRLGRDGAKALRKQHSGIIWMAGVLMVVPLTIPVVNLFVPILGAATFTHLFHRLQKGG